MDEEDSYDFKTISTQELLALKKLILNTIDYYTTILKSDKIPEGNRIAFEMCKKTNEEDLLSLQEELETRSDFKKKD